MFYDFSQGKGDVGIPMMDFEEAIRRILAIMNSNAAPGGNPVTPGGGGSTTSVGSTFNSQTNVTIDAPSARKVFPTVATPRGILVVARVGNTNPVCIGGPGVTDSTGSECGITLTAAGMTSVVIPVSNANLVYVNGLTTGDGVGFVVL